MYLPPPLASECIVSSGNLLRDIPVSVGLSVEEECCCNKFFKCYFKPRVNSTTILICNVYLFNENTL